MNNQRRRGGLIGLIVLFIFGIAFTILGTIFVKINDSQKEKCTEAVQAYVVDHMESNSDDSTTYTPVFEYEYNGNSYQSYSNTYSSGARSQFPVGSELTIYVNPNNPEDIYCEEMSAIFGTIGKIFKYVGLGILALAIISLIVKIIKLVVLGGALGIAAAQTKKFNQQQAEFYGQQQWNNMNQGQTIYFDNQQPQGQPMQGYQQNYQQQGQPMQGQPMQGQPQNYQQQGQGLQGLGNIDFGNRQ